MDKAISYGLLPRKQRVKLVIKPYKLPAGFSSSIKPFDMYQNDQSKIQITQKYFKYPQSTSPSVPGLPNLRKSIKTPHTEDNSIKISSKNIADSAYSVKNLCKIKIINKKPFLQSKTERIHNKSVKILKAASKNLRLRLLKYESFKKNLPSWTVREKLDQIKPKEINKINNDLSFDLKGWD
jgi:hypothetical protein